MPEPRFEFLGFNNFDKHFAFLMYCINHFKVAISDIFHTIKKHGKAIEFDGDDIDFRKAYTEYNCMYGHINNEMSKEAIHKTLLIHPVTVIIYIDEYPIGIAYIDVFGCIERMDNTLNMIFILEEEHSKMKEVIADRMVPSLLKQYDMEPDDHHTNNICTIVPKFKG